MSPANRILPAPSSQSVDSCQLQLRMVDSSDPAVRAFVETGFHQVHGARIQQLLPCQLALYHDTELVAVIGLRPARGNRLFLEHYLDAPIEQLLAGELELPVSRSDIVEVGNLVAASGWGRMAILAATAYLAGQRYSYVAFTATRTLRSGFQRLGLKPRLLAPALATAVPDPAQWGRYYQERPCVVWGEIQTGWQQVCARPDWHAALAQVRLPDGCR